MGGSTAAPVDYAGMQAGITGAANQQFQNNRLDTSNPFGSQTFNPDGTVSSQFSGGLGAAATGLQGQAAGLATPMDWSRFGTVGTGDAARQQAVDSSYNQSISRLDPQWDKRMEAQRTQLLNQGLDPTSEAYKGSMSDLSMQRNDAYGGAMANAQQLGTSAGNSVFQNNLASQQANIANALRQRQMPLQEMQQLMGFLGQQPQYSMDNTSLAGAMGSANLAQSAANQKFQEEQAAAQQSAGTAGGIMSGIGTAAGIAAMFF